MLGSGLRRGSTSSHFEGRQSGAPLSVRDTPNYSQDGEADAPAAPALPRERAMLLGRDNST
jgi:hypothetical protein